MFGGSVPVAVATHRHRSSSDLHIEESGLSNDGTVPVTCLGCGCTCDDVRLTLVGGAIAKLAPACAVASVWARDGRVPSMARVGGAVVTRDAALDRAATLLHGARGRLLVVLAPGLPTASYGAAVAIADQLGAAVETPHGTMSAEWVLAGQRRGRALATLGEIRHRADLFVYWGVTPDAEWPRFAERFAERSIGLHSVERSVVAVSIGDDWARVPAGMQVVIAPDAEVAAIGVMRAVLRGEQTDARLPEAAALATRMAAARYVAIITSADGTDPARSTARAEALLALAQQLNGPTSRCALSVLRAGGNVAGIESLLTWQTGFPMAVDFASGAPAYAPERRGAARAASGAFAAALLVGDAAGLPQLVRDAALALPHVLIGPRASEQSPAAAVSIDTGLAGLHEAGTAYRMDDVPLPVEAPLPHPLPSGALLDALRDRLTRTGATA